MAEHRRSRAAVAALMVTVLMAGGCGSNKVAGSGADAKKGHGAGGAIRSDSSGPLGSNTPTFNFTAPTIKPPPPPTTIKHHYHPFHRVRR